MRSLIKTLITSLLFGSSLNTWADEAMNHNYVEFNATQINESSSYDLYGGGVESQYVITDNIYLHGAYNQYSNSDENISQYLIGLGTWIEPADNIILTAYSQFKKSKVSLNNYWNEDKLNYNLTEGTFGAEVKYNIIESVSLLSQFDITNSIIKLRSSPSSEYFKDEINIRRFAIGIKWQFKKFTYEFLRNSFYSDNENFSRKKTIKTKVSYHFTEKFNLGINLESTDENAMYQLVGRYTL